MIDFDALTYQECFAWVNGSCQPWQQENRAFYSGDHLQKGAGWVGPGPNAGDAGHAEFVQVLEPAFIFKNAIKKGTDTKVNALLGRTPVWGMALARDTEKEATADDEAERIAKVDAALTPWWDENEVHGRLQEFGTNLELVGRANLRAFIPDSERNPETGEVKLLPLAESLRRIEIDAPAYNRALIYEDKVTRRRIGIYCYREEDEKWLMAGPHGFSVLTGRNYVELTYLDDKGFTVLRTLAEGSTESTSLTIDLGGLLWHFQAEDEPLISAAVRSQQKKLNFAETTGRRNLADNGWLEEFLINARLPGKYEDDPEHPGKRIFKADPIRRGPGVSRQLASEVYETEDESGIKQQVFPADVKWRPPVDTQGAMDVGQRAEWNIADEMSQLHTLEGGGDNSSGEALKQRRAAFGVSLLKSQTHLNNAGRWVLGIALALASAYAAEADAQVLAGLRVNFNCRVDTGPRTAIEREEDAKRVAAGLMSLEEALNRDGVDDVDDEIRKIQSQPGSQVALQLKQAELCAALMADFDLDTASRVAFGGEALIDVLREKKLIPEPVVST